MDDCALPDVLPPNYSLAGFRAFDGKLAVAACRGEDVDHWFRKVLWARSAVERAVAPFEPSAWPDRLLVVVAESAVAVQEELERRRASHAAPTVASFWSDPLPHILVGAAADSSDRCLVHELTHAYFSSVSAPRWIHEGLAMLSEMKVLGSLPEIGPEYLKEALDDLHNLGDLLADQAFADEDPVRRVAAYRVAFYSVKDMLLRGETDLRQQVTR